jgi:hypothetical protein
LDLFLAEEQAMKRRALHRRYGRTMSGYPRHRYSHRQATANALEENVYFDGQLVGTVTMKDFRRWEWRLAYAPVGSGGFIPHGRVFTKSGGIEKVIAADKPGSRPTPQNVQRFMEGR